MSEVRKRLKDHTLSPALDIDVFWLPKSDHTVKEYEDAFAVHAARGWFAIADGASEAIFAGRWARILVQAAICSPPRSAAMLKKWMKPLQRRWHEQIDWEALPWFSLEKARQGAFSTLLILTFHKARVDRASRAFGRWQALAVGDSCLFHLRKGALLLAFPLSQAEEFGLYPALLSSHPLRNNKVWEKVHVIGGDYRSNDLFIMATDAFAQWFLTEIEHGARPWEKLRDLASRTDSRGEFQEWISTLRQNQAIRDDDVTVVVIRVMAQTH